MRAPVHGLLIVLLISHFAFAAPRTWKDVTGKHAIEAEFIELNGTMVRLKRTDGREVSLALEKLSAPDRIAAMREWRLREAVAPQLSAKGKELTAQLVAAVRSQVGMARINRLTFESLDDELAPALRTLLEKGEELVAAEGRTTAVAPAVAEMLGDVTPAVRAVAARAAQELSDGMVSAAPALIGRLTDQEELVANLSRQALEHMTSSTDAVVPALVSALQFPPEEQAKEAARLLVHVQQAGPHVEAAVPKLAEMMGDRKLADSRRTWAGYALAAFVDLLGEEQRLDPRLRLEYYDETTAGELEAQKSAGEKIVAAACSTIAPLLTANQSAELTAITFAVLGRHSKTALQSLSSDKMSRLLESLETAEFDRDLMRNIDSPLDLLGWLVSDRNLSLQLPPETALRMLLDDDSRLQRLAQAQLTQSADKARQVLPELIKMVKSGKTAENRVAAIHVLQHPAFRAGSNLSSMPGFVVNVGGGRGGPLSLSAAGKKFSDTTALAAAVKAFQPPKPPAEEASIDAVLKQAAGDPDEEVHYVAVQALAIRGTPEAKAALRELSRTALKIETRQLAQELLANREGVDRFGRGQPDDGSPFDPRESRAKREFAVDLNVEGDVPMQQVVSLVRAAMETDAAGVRLSLVKGQVAESTRIEIQTSETRHLSEPLYTLLLEERREAAKTPIKIQTLQHNGQWRRPPGFEALQFTLSWDLADQMRPASDYGDSMDDTGPAFIGSSALPILAAIECEPNATFDDGLHLLEAIGTVHKDAGSRRDMIQWVRFKNGTEKLPIWYVKIAAPSQPATK